MIAARRRGSVSVRASVAMRIRCRYRSPSRCGTMALRISASWASSRGARSQGAIVASVADGMRAMVAPRAAARRHGISDRCTSGHRRLRRAAAALNGRADAMILAAGQCMRHRQPGQCSGSRGKRRRSKIERHISAATTRPGSRLDVLVSSRCLAAAACAAEPLRILSSITSIRRPSASRSALPCRRHGRTSLRKRRARSYFANLVM
jgi:hypothetical protein